MSAPGRIDYDEYARIKAVNWSTLKELRRSPLRYRHRLEHPREDNTRLALGRAAHTAVFEPDQFMRQYACFRGSVRRGKKWESFKEANEGVTILKLDEYDQCLRIRDAVRSHPSARRYLEHGKYEQSFTWTDEVTGVACKGRADWVGTALGDLKTTSDVDENRFGALAARMLYHAQLAFYRDGIAAITGEVLPVVIIAVEQDAPHDVAVFRLDEDALYAGQETYRELLERVAICRQVDSWPGRHPEETTLRLPAWVYGSDEDDDTTGLDLVVNGQR